MSHKSEKYVHKGLAWKQRGSFDQRAKGFVLAAHGGDTPETYQKLRGQAGGQPDLEVLAKSIAFMNKLASQPKRKRERK
mgnify:CR=1 FL=1